MQRVYCIGWRELGPCKIGIAENVQRRIRDLQPGSPFTLLEFYSQELGGNQWTNKEVSHLESILHERFRFVRLCGEWFDVRVSHVIPIIRQTVGRYASMHARDASHYWRMRLKRHQFWYNFPANDRRSNKPIDWSRVR